MILDDLRPFLEANAGIAVVTDIKERRNLGLRRVAHSLAELRDRSVPQAHHRGELLLARELDFKRVILTLYEEHLSDEEVLDLAASGDIWAVTMPVRKAFSSDLPARLARRGVPVFAHTVNDRLTLAALQEVGVHGVYTDSTAH